MDDQVLDVAIIGAGVSGLYTGYRLLQAGDGQTAAIAQHLGLEGDDHRPLNIHLFEMSGRIGGRLWSVCLPGLPNVPAEVGGMRFLPSQESVTGLCQALNLEVVEFGFDNHIQYLRGCHFNFEDYQHPDRLPDGGKFPFNLRLTEQGQDPIRIVRMALSQLVPAIQPFLQQSDPLNNQQLAELIDTLKRAVVAQQPELAKPLTDCGFWNLLSTVCSVEAYNLIIAASGYFMLYENWNAYDAALEFIRNFADSRYKTLAEGYDALPKALAREFQQLGGQIHLHHQVSQVEQASADCGDPLFIVTVAAPGQPPKQIQARCVFLAIPQRSIELIKLKGTFYDGFSDDLYTVTPVPASKLFLSYDRPWWQDIQPQPDGVPSRRIEKGRSSTDLPLRQCYYFGTEADGKSLLMASYNDGHAVPFWHGYLPSARFGPYYNNQLRKRPTLAQEAMQGAGDQLFWGVDGAAIDAPELLATQTMVEEAQRQLMELHRQQVPQPRAAVYHDWMQDPYGGAYHLWNPFLKSWEIMPRVREPFPGAKLFIVGEAFSTNQGWVEGALNTAEKVLQDRFGLSRPSWVSESYDFGP